jgi:glutamate 5-kinase
MGKGASSSVGTGGMSAKLAAAQIAVSTVQKFIAENEMPKKVIFNVFQQRDEQIYQTLLNKQNKF